MARNRPRWKPKLENHRRRNVTNFINYKKIGKKRHFGNPIATRYVMAIDKMSWEHFVHDEHDH